MPWTNLGALDLVWGVIAPIVALWLRDPYLFVPPALSDTLIYIVLGAVFTGISFVWFRLSHSVSRFFSLADALTVLKAAAVAVTCTAVAGFILTRLDNIPRSAPIIHFVVLAAGNIAGRAARHLRRRQRDRAPAGDRPAENLIIVGVSDLSSFYIQMIEQFGSDLYRVVALVDDGRSLQGRFVHGYPVAGRIADIDAVIDEYQIHGVQVHRLVLSAEPASLPPDQSELLFDASKRRRIPLEVLPERLGLAQHTRPPAQDIDAEGGHLESRVETGFWRGKRRFDVLAAAVLLVLAAPVLMAVAALILLDSGMPVTFWQVRIGRYRQKITVYKFRTLRAPYDRGGARIPEERRLSWIGRFLRITHLDELPQLVSVIIGDMSLVGPRPLLPIDLSTRSRVRLAVRPGITGWAQVNGATLLTAEEKNAMDEWYVRHAAWPLELRIFAGTLRALFFGARRNEAAIRAALCEQDEVARTPPAGAGLRSDGR